MPIYEYECKSCSLRFELKRRFGENSGASCPQCQGEARRIFSPVPIFFKGPGFYITDNAAGQEKRLGSRRDGDKPADMDKCAEHPNESKAEAAS